MEHKTELDALSDKVVYTGPIDAYFNYSLGYLEYRSVRFETELLDTPNFQGNAAVNYTDRETQWTRIIEHKWFEFGKDAEGNDLSKTVISVSTAPSGSLVTSRTIRLMMKRTVSYISSIRLLRIKNLMSSLVGAW